MIICVFILTSTEARLAHKLSFRFFFVRLFFFSDKETNLDSFELEAPSGVISQELMQADCKIRMPADWESRATARVSLSFNTLVNLSKGDGNARKQ